MYEFNAVLKLVEALLDWAKKNNVEEVLVIRLRIGEAVMVDPDHVKRNFQLLTKGTLIGDAILQIENEESIVKCKECGYKGRYLSQRYGGGVILSPKCPKCGGKAEIVQGEEYVIKGIRYYKKGSRLAEETFYDV
ncbi:MAG: hydrogenase maturation nickel metallochaperone HypA [Nitrososphaeria archaeon]